MESNTDARFPGAGLVLATCTWLALLGGLIELQVVWWRKMQDPLLQVSQDYAWSIPIGLVATVLATAAPFLIARRVRPSAALRLALFCAATVVFLDLLLLVRRLAPYAALLLAAGLATQIVRVLWRDPARTGRIVRRSLPVITVLAVALASIVWFSSAAPAVPATSGASASPNVLIITLDTVRADSLSVYGYGRATTPHLARYAKRGVVFDLAFATAPWTLPSHGSMMTGRWPHELKAGYRTPIGREYPTLAEYFSSRGYATGGFVANLGYCGRGTGLERGFSHYEDYPRSIGQIFSNSTLLRNVADNFNVRRWIRNDEHLNRVTAAAINARFLSWVSRNGQAPFFAFLNYFDAHEPYLPPAPFNQAFGPAREYGRHSPLHHAQWNPAVPSRELSTDALREEIDAYDGAIASLDDRLGALFDELGARGLLQNTLVVVTADHGEEFAEHRVLEHGYSLYRRSVHVPLVMMLPGSIPADVRISTPVSLRDLAATITALTGDASRHLFPGESLSGLWGAARPAGAATGPILSELTRPPGNQPEWFPVSRGDMVSIVYRGMRYIRNGDATEELYDLGADPPERQNLAGQPGREPLLQEIRATLGQTLQKHGR